MWFGIQFGRPVGDTFRFFGTQFGKRLSQSICTVALPVILSFDLHVKSFGSDIYRCDLSVIISW